MRSAALIAGVAAADGNDSHLSSRSIVGLSGVVGSSARQLGRRCVGSGIAARSPIGVGERDRGGVLWRDAGVEGSDDDDRGDPAEGLGDDVAGADAGAMPANVFENIRPIVIAGFAKLAELVKK